MANFIYRLVLLLLFAAVLPANIFSQDSVRENHDTLTSFFTAKINGYLNSKDFIEQSGYHKRDSTGIDSIRINTKSKNIELYLDDQLSYAPMRPGTVDSIISKLSHPSIPLHPDFSLSVFSNGEEIHKYIPNYYAAKKDIDAERIVKRFKRKSVPLVQNISKPGFWDYALYNINIALWHSHGWYYEPKLHRWEWERARLFNTVEDLHPMSYTVNFLVPMLENAGSNVFLPRERDLQVNEVIVDNDGSSGNSLFVSHHESLPIDSGFSIGTPPYIDENPFKTGTALKFDPGKNSTVLAEWIPDIPESGYYAVYISYHSSGKNSDNAVYTVYHAGGETSFRVNQNMGGGTWIYLGEFKFDKGLDKKTAMVSLSSGGKKDVLTADAVRFGGGMGNISRNGLVSKRPRYQEGARYYLQYAGFPDTLVWKLNLETEDDYKDDYQCRGEWVTYLQRGSEYSSVEDERGPAIPVDLSLAFHTDAGITDNDTVIGTLGIYSTKLGDSHFSSGLSKLASRDLTDIIQTQIVNDIREKYDPAWTRRGMWDKGYSEAYRPNAPAMLLELYSHQNFIDSRFGKEPFYQFDVSRSIYKGMVKFLSSLYGIDYIIQPLPVHHFQTEILENGDFHLRWKAQPDPLESTADAEAYIVYTRKDQEAYDNGTWVQSEEYTVPAPEEDVIYSFKVSAVNGGGESFPSEELSICKSSSGKETVLIVNAFDRTGGAYWFNDENYAGFIDNVDMGVPYMYDFHTVGEQYDYRKDSKWLDDDSPGFGASSAEMEEVLIPGNTFNFSKVHGESIRKAGYSFASVSDEVFESGLTDHSKYAALDVIAGEEKTSYLPKNDSVKHFQLFTPGMISELDSYLKSGGSLLLTGAHIATDIRINGLDSLAASILKFKWRTSSASRTGSVSASGNFVLDDGESFVFNSLYHPEIYTVEAADALEPADDQGKVFARYTENSMSAGVAYSGDYKLLAIGFPFETIIQAEARDRVMEAFLDYLLDKESR